MLLVHEDLFNSDILYIRNNENGLVWQIDLEEGPEYTFEEACELILINDFAALGTFFMWLLEQIKERMNDHLLAEYDKGVPIIYLMWEDMTPKQQIFFEE